MARFIRRLLLFAILGAAVAAAVRAIRARPAVSAPPDTGPTWPPLQAAAAPEPADQAWVEPVDGACPTGYPVKANSASHIYHVPGGQFYERTVPERCYADAHAAE